MSYTIKFGNRNVAVDFDNNQTPGQTVKLTCDGYQLDVNSKGTVTGPEIASGIHQLVALVADEEQAAVNEKRAIEDAQRILGGVARKKIAGII